MSPRAALRLEHLGFKSVYDYVNGKADWMAAGLPREGETVGWPYPGDLADPGVPTCVLKEPARPVLQRMSDEAQSLCVVIDENKIVLGVLHPGRHEEVHLDSTVESLMYPGPATIRANEPIEPLVQRMERRNVETILVTNPEGRLLGLLDRRVAEEALGRSNG